jgi:transcriptional regulator with XRE-family HTH domain
MPRLPKEPDQTTFVGRIAAEIRRRRVKKKLTVEAAAAAGDVPAPTWYRRENGRGLTLESLPAIAAALGCQARDLIPKTLTER